MKVTRSQGVSRPTSARRGAGAAAPDRAAAAPRDTLTIAGIPQAELTPRVKKALSDLMAEVQSLRTALAETKAQMDELAALAFSDPLTGVYNRRAFVAELDRTLAMVDRHGQPASLAFFDLDEMKAINDRHGHLAGDAALKHVARVITANVRRTDVVGRLGGDEFAVIFNYADQDSAAVKVRELTDRVISAPVSVGAAQFDVKLTAGVAEIAKGATVEAALEIADAAMYKSKRSR